MSTLKSYNPYNEKLVYENEAFDPKQVEDAIENSHKQFRDWKKTSFEFRVKCVLNLADIVEENKQIWGEVITQEMGKPISQSIAEIEKCSWLCRYYAENGEQQLQLNYIKTEAKESYVRYDPLGVILGVMPWNFPFWQVFRFAIPTIMAGNTVLLKHASNVQESAKCIEEAFQKSSFPKNVYINLPVGSKMVASIIRNRKVKGVSLTGSKPAGAAVASVAAEEIKPSLLELGGNNASVVFADCNWDATIEKVIHARFLNTGQSCIAGKRLFVQEEIAERFIKEITEKVKHLKVGDPLNKDTFIGTLVNEDAAVQLKKQLDDSVELGAKIVVGGNHNKAFFEPTVVENVTPNMPIYEDETFGPLLACSIFNNEDEVVRKVNQSHFGLGVSIYTTNQERISRQIPKFEDGSIFVNELVKSDPRLPFGGTKISGYGRELSREGILAFVNKKTVYIQ